MRQLMVEAFNRKVEKNALKKEELKSKVHLDLPEKKAANDKQTKKAKRGVKKKGIFDASKNKVHPGCCQKKGLHNSEGDMWPKKNRIWTVMGEKNYL